MNMNIENWELKEVEENIDETDYFLIDKLPLSDHNVRYRLDHQDDEY